MTKELQKRKLISPKYVSFRLCLVCRISLVLRRDTGLQGMRGASRWSEGRKGYGKSGREEELTDRKHIHYSISKGPQFALEVKQLETDLTVEMLASYVPFTSAPSSYHHPPLTLTCADLQWRMERRFIQKLQFCSCRSITRRRCFTSIIEDEGGNEADLL